MLDSDKFSAIICFVVASVAHLVERHLAKVEVAGSSPVTRSKKKDTLLSVSFFGLFVRTDRCPLPAEHPPFPGLWPERNLFMELLCKWNQLFVMLRLHCNPSVTASPCHLPLHKGGFTAVQNRTLYDTPKGV